MDGKQQLNQLDPKLQEAYNRVMGTNVPPPAPGPANPQPSTPNPPPPSAPPTPVEVVVPTSPPPPSQPTPVEPTPPSPPAQTDASEDNMAATVSIGQVYTATPSTGPTPKPSAAAPTGFVASATVSGPKKHSISPVILVLGVIVFFVVYTLVWIKVFNLSLPFLPQ